MRHYRLQDRLKKIQGNLAVAFMVVAVTSTTGMLMWNYVNKISALSPTAVKAAEARAVAETVAARLKMHTVRQGGAIVSCGGTMVCIVCIDMSEFRDLSKQNVSAPSPSINLTTSGGIGGWATPCVVANEELGQVAGVTMAMTTPGQKTDIPNLMRPVRIEVKVDPSYQKGSSASPQTVIKNYALKVGLISDFNVIFHRMDNTLIGKTISVADGSTVLFTGAVFNSALNGSPQLILNNFIDIESVLTGPEPSISFERAVYFRNPAVLYPGLTGGAAFFPGDYKKIFKQGMELTVAFDYDANATMGSFGSGMLVTPNIYDQMDNAATLTDINDVSKFNIKLDYDSHSGQPSYEMYPLPDMSYNSGAVAKYPNESTGPVYNAANGNLNVIPHGPGKFFSTVDKTCEPGKTFVYQRISDDLTVDFTALANGGADKSAFCGLVMAKKLTVIAPPGSNIRGMFGIFIVQQIEIKGGGKVVFYNPGNSVPTSVALPTGQSQTNLFSEYYAKSGGITHNFFIPLGWRNTSGTSGGQVGAKYLPIKPYDPASPGTGYMEPCAGCAHTPKHMCWKNNVPPLDYHDLFGGPTGTGEKFHDGLLWFMQEIL